MTDSPTSKQVLDKKQVAASNVPFKAQNLGRDPEAQGPSPLDLLQAEIERLRAAISEHNTACQARCGVGDREAMECGYRPYFENTGRRCPNCPTYEMIDMPADETPAVTEAAAVEARARANFNATHGIVENLWELQVGANRQLWIDAARRQLAADKTNEERK